MAYGLRREALPDDCQQSAIPSTAARLALACAGCWAATRCASKEAGVTMSMRSVFVSCSSISSCGTKVVPLTFSAAHAIARSGGATSGLPYYANLGRLQPHAWRSASYPPIIERTRTKTAKPAGTHQYALTTSPERALKLPRFMRLLAKRVRKLPRFIALLAERVRCGTSAGDVGRPTPASIR